MAREFRRVVTGHDEHGKAIRARFTVAGKKIESAADGFFNVSVPHGGVFPAEIEALYLDDHGWIPLRDNRPHFWIDTDDPGTDCRFELGGRMLFLARGKMSIHMSHLRRASADELPGRWSIYIERDPPAGTYGVLSRRLRHGDYLWRRGSCRRLVVRIEQDLSQFGIVDDVAPT